MLQPLRVIAIGGKPVRDIALRRKVRKHDALHASSDTVQVLRDHIHVRLARFVIISDHHNGATVEPAIQVLTPLSRTAMTRRREKACTYQRVGTLLTLNDKYRAVRLTNDKRKVVRQWRDAIHIPNPAALIVRMPLDKTLRLITKHLIRQNAILVIILIDLRQPFLRADALLNLTRYPEFMLQNFVNGL